MYDLPAAFFCSVRAVVHCIGLHWTALHSILKMTFLSIRPFLFALTFLVYGWLRVVRGLFTVGVGLSQRSNSAFWVEDSSLGCSNHGRTGFHSASVPKSVAKLWQLLHGVVGREVESVAIAS
jgi:hypothetical protein